MGERVNQPICWALGPVQHVRGKGDAPGESRIYCYKAAGHDGEHLARSGKRHIRWKQGGRHG